MTFRNGKKSPDRDDAARYPVFGSNGTIGRSNDTNADENTIVIGRVGTYCGSLHFSKGPCWVTDNAIACSTPQEEARFWFYALSSLELNNYRAGSGQPLLNQSILKQISYGVPPADHRKAIGEMLGTLDDKIELNRQTNETLEAMARAFFKDWFVDFGPTRAKAEGRSPYLVPTLWDLFPDALKDDKPVGWVEETVHAQAHWVNGAAYKNMHFTDAPNALPVIKIVELKAGVTKNTKFTNTALGDKYRITDGELLFSWSGNPDTSIDTFIWTGGDAWLNQHIFAVRNNGKRPLAFLYAMLKWLNPDFSEIARNKQTTGLGHVTQQDLKRLLVNIGSAEIMMAFDDLVAPIFDRIYRNLMEIRVLSETRDLLLPKLISGEIRMREAEIAVEAVV